MYSKYLFLIDISKDSGPLQVSNHLISILIVFIANYQNYDGRYLMPSGLINPEGDITRLGFRVTSGLIFWYSRPRKYVIYGM